MKNKFKNVSHVLTYLLYFSDHFFDIFFKPLTSTRTKKVSGLIVNDLALKNSTMDMHCNPIPLQYGLFLWNGGGPGTPSGYR